MCVVVVVWWILGVCIVFVCVCCVLVCWVWYCDCYWLVICWYLVYCEIVCWKCWCYVGVYLLCNVWWGFVNVLVLEFLFWGLVCVIIGWLCGVCWKNVRVFIWYVGCWILFVVCCELLVCWVWCCCWWLWYDVGVMRSVYDVIGMFVVGMWCSVCCFCWERIWIWLCWM